MKLPVIHSRNNTSPTGTLKKEQKVLLSLSFCTLYFTGEEKIACEEKID